MNTKRFLIGLASSSLFLVPFVTHAQGMQFIYAGDLIKASGPSVYYYGEDGKRYVFPNEKTYFTWYTGFSSIKTVQDITLTYLAIGGNVTYRPGLKLVKIQTDPKVYAVAHGGMLRWVQTEAVARDLYGVDWNTKVDDIPDTFFINYRVGTPIASATDYSVNGELAVATSIGADRGLDEPTPPPTPPPPPPTPTSTTPPPPPSHYGSIEATPPEVAANQSVTLIGRAQPSSGITYVDLFFNGTMVRRCEYSPCGTDVMVPSGQSTYEAGATFVWIDGHTYRATTTVFATAASTGVALTVRPEIEPNAAREIIVDVDSTFTAKTIDMYLDGGIVRGCNDVQSCRYTALETSPVGTVHMTYAIARDANGFTRQSATKSFTVVTNDRPLVTVTPGKTSMFAGETIDVTVQASDDDGVAYTEIATDDGSFTKRCMTFTCQAVVQRPNPGTFRFIGRAADSLGAVASATSSAIVVQ